MSPSQWAPVHTPEAQASGLSTSSGRKAARTLRRRPVRSLLNLLEYAFKNPSFLEQVGVLVLLSESQTPWNLSVIAQEDTFQDRKNDNRYNCSGCGDKVRARKETVIAALPAQFVVLHVSRTCFDPKSFRVSKDQHHLEFPLDGLDLSPFVDGGDKATGKGKGKGKSKGNAASRQTWSLCAVVNHHGRSMDIGHFTCYARPPEADGTLGKDWFLFNDASVKHAKPEEVQASQAYLLFYQAVQQ